MRNDRIVAVIGEVEVRTGDDREYVLIRALDQQVLYRVNDLAAAKARAAEISAAMAGVPA